MEGRPRSGTGRAEAWLDLGRELGCEYVVVEKRDLEAPTPAPAYENERLVILRVGPGD